jgi:S1-C subfamily serine protease
VDPVPETVPGSVVVVIPSHATLREAPAVANPATPGVNADIAADVVEINLSASIKALEKAKVFNSATLVRATDSASEPSDKYDYKLWVTAGATNGWKWYLSKTGGGGRELDLSVNTPTVKQTERLSNFTIAVVNAASDLGAPVSHHAYVIPGVNKLGPSTGTSFFINNAGYALTNAHVAEGCKSLKLVTGEGGETEASLVKLDHTNDLALIKVPSHTGGFASFRNGAPVRQGEDVVVYGFPLTGGLATQGNLTTGVVSALAGLKDDTRMLQISAPVQPGNSGGPLFDTSGNVIGIVSGKLNTLNVARVTGDIAQNVNFAIKTNIVANFLETNGVKYEQAVSKASLHTADISDRAKAFTFMVKCQR